MKADCPECKQPIDVEYVDVGIGQVWHGVHCGWGHEFSPDDAYNDENECDYCGNLIESELDHWLLEHKLPHESFCSQKCLVNYYADHALYRSL